MSSLFARGWDDFPVKAVAVFESRLSIKTRAPLTQLKPISRCLITRIIECCRFYARNWAIRLGRTVVLRASLVPYVTNFSPSESFSTVLHFENGLFTIARCCVSRITPWTSRTVYKRIYELPVAVLILSYASETQKNETLCVTVTFTRTIAMTAVKATRKRINVADNDGMTKFWKYFSEGDDHDEAERKSLYR